MIDKKKLAVIHIVKKELNLSEEEYRNTLMRVAGVNSAKELDAEKFRKLMNYFVRSDYYRINPWGLTIKQKLYIKYLAQNLGWTDEHMSNFIRKYYHKAGIDKLTRKDAVRLIESLKAVTGHKEYSS